MKKYIFLFFLSFSFQVLADDLANSNKVFDWAEENHSQFFSPPGVETFRFENYWARYYQGTDTYIGTLGEDVYVFGIKVFGGLLKVGKISDFVQIDEASNISGRWQLQGRSDERDCGEGIDNFTRTFIISDDLMTALSSSGNTLNLTVNGNTVSSFTQYSEDGGITTERGSFVVNGDTFTGNSNWSWTDGFDSCSGTVTFSGSKI